MKKSILILVSIILFSCGEKDKKTVQIEQNVTESAMGNDLNYEPKETKEIASVTHNDIYEVFLTQMGEEMQPVEEILPKLERIVAKEKESNNVESYHYLKFELDRLNDYKAAENKEEVVYTVYEHSYTINNPMFDDKLVNVTNYYFFDNNEKLLGKVSDSEFKELKRTNIKHDKMAYEAMAYEIHN